MLVKEFIGRILERASQDANVLNAPLLANGKDGELIAPVPFLRIMPDGSLAVLLDAPRDASGASSPVKEKK